MELVFRPRTAYNSRNFTVSYCLYANWISKWLCGHSKKQELNKVLFTNLYYHINITNITKHIFMKPNTIKHEWVYTYITQAPKINRHAESICFTLAQMNKYIVSQNKSKIVAFPRCLKFKTLCSQIHQWRSVEENLGL